MSCSTDLFESKFENSKKKKEDYIFHRLLYNCVYKYHLTNYTILEKYRMKEDLENKISCNHTWEITKDGFENRSNYGYDEENQEITFERNIIYVNEKNCFTNNTNIAKAHFYNNRFWLSLLREINEEINQTVKQFEGIIKEQLKEIKEDDYYSEQHINESVYYADLFVKSFIADYGKLGRELLIKWLNRLNDSSKSYEELADEYLKDMNNAKIYFESYNHQKYLMGIEHGVKFDYILLRVIEKYSPRGIYFGDTYRKIYPRKRYKQNKKMILDN